MRKENLSLFVLLGMIAGSALEKETCPSFLGPELAFPAVRARGVLVFNQGVHGNGTEWSRRHACVRSDRRERQYTEEGSV